MTHAEKVKQETANPSPNLLQFLTRPAGARLAPGAERAEPDEVLVKADEQEQEGTVYHLRGHVRLQTTDAILLADEVDYDRESGDALATGDVRYENLITGERLTAQRAEYNVVAERGRFFGVRGTSPPQVYSKPGLLTSRNPFYFEGEWAERLRDRTIVHNGTITNCRIPKPWWTLRSPKFDVVPGQRAITRNAVLRLKGVPIFYAPYFYKSLERRPRNSGFLMPSFGNSTRRGLTYGSGYYWAINRSYDLLYRGTYFSRAGLVNEVGFRGKPYRGGDFSASLFALRAKRDQSQNPFKFVGGFNLVANGKFELKKGWQARGALNFLSDFGFRQSFSENFFEAIFSEVNSIGFLSKHYGANSLYVAAQRHEQFENRDGRTSKISLRRLPEMEWTGNDREVIDGPVPVWISWRGTAGAMRRNQPQFQTRQFVERLDFTPRIGTALHWGHLHIVPSFGLRTTYYGSRLQQGDVTGTGLLRHARDVEVDVALPSLARVFNKRGFWGEKLKHVVEPRAVYRYISGVNDFREIIRFDETELLSNTHEVEMSLTNRVYTKRKDGQVNEALSWSVRHKRYLDPTFGGAVVQDARNVVWSQLDLTAFAFLNQPRRYSPVVSVLRLQPDGRLGLEWRADYDPLRQGLTASSLSAFTRLGAYSINLGHQQLRDVRFLSRAANTMDAVIAYGQENRKGWNGAFSINYDYQRSIMNFATTQVTYNTDCCGFNVQVRRIAFRNDNIIRFAFVLANIGSFGSLRRQERIF